jgi:predicted nucleic-acid-binding Zn-ribbon protein
MRKTGICPKCTHNQLLHIGMVADKGEFESEVRPLSLAAVFTGHGFFGDEKRTSAGHLTAVMCRGCGYAELYVADPQSIVPDGKYITEMSGPQRTSPHR